MKEYRCTRPSIYEANTPGHTNTRARQGYYIEAATKREAHRLMCKKFPEDCGWFDIEEWKDPAPSTVVSETA